jgi:hypothetical protein
LAFWLFSGKPKVHRRWSSICRTSCTYRIIICHSCICRVVISACAQIGDMYTAAVEDKPPMDCNFSYVLIILFFYNIILFFGMYYVCFFGFYIIYIIIIFLDMFFGKIYSKICVFLKKWGFGIIYCFIFLIIIIYWCLLYFFHYLFNLFYIF